MGQREHAFSSSFGSEGSGPGQLMRPGALAVNEATGNVYVIDRDNNRVDIFSSSGQYVSDFNGSEAPTGPLSWTGKAFSESGIPGDGGIAVDNSTDPADPSKGDVYVLDWAHGVVNKFTDGGVYLGQVVGRSATSRYSPATGVPKTIAVAPNGELWVQVGVEQTSSKIDQFNDALSNEYISTIKAEVQFEGTELSENIGPVGFAIESEENFYMGKKPTVSGKFTFPEKFSKDGQVLLEKLDYEETTGFAVDLSSNDVYIDHETSVAAYGPSNAPIERFGSPELQVSEGIAVDSKTGAVYVSDASAQDIDVFSAFVV